MTRALITGVTGQDGPYLAKLLLQKGYTVCGTYCGDLDEGQSRFRQIGLEGPCEFVPLDLCKPVNLDQMIEEFRPDEVYNLAAQSSVANAFDTPLFTAEINAMGVLRLLEVLRKGHSDCRFFQASSGQMFNIESPAPQNESTPFRPRDPYGASKLFAHWATVSYRESHGMFTCSGILFNHESPLRGTEFVMRKVSDAVARIKIGDLDRLQVGNLDVRRDWGYAADYVEAMWLMLQAKKPDDYVIATGEAHTVREIVETAFDAVGIDLVWQGEGTGERGLDRHNGKTVAEVSPKLFRPMEVDVLLGDATKAHDLLGWKARTRFHDLVRLMVEEDLKRVSLGVV